MECSYSIRTSRWWAFPFILTCGRAFTFVLIAHGEPQSPCAGHAAYASQFEEPSIDAHQWRGRAASVSWSIVRWQAMSPDEFFCRRSESMNSLPTVGLRTPPRTLSPVPTIRVSESTPSTDRLVHEDVAAEPYEPNSPPESGSTTPTNGLTIDSASGRKSMAFLDLSPFTGFLRSRYQPSTHSISRKSPSGEHSDVRSVDANSEVDVGSETVEDGCEVGEQDVSGGERGKAEMNGHANGTRVEEEKHPGEEDGTITPVTRGILLHPTATG